MKKAIFLVSFFCVYIVHGQRALKIGNNPMSMQSTSVFELESTNKGLLLPRLTNAQASAVVSSAKTNGASGLLVYNSDCKCLQVFDASTTTGQWNSITGAVGTPDWALTGNTGTDPSTQFIGTTDTKDLVFKVNNVERLRLTTGGVVNFSQNKLSNFSANISTVAGSTYTLASSVNGSILVFSSNANVLITVPASLPVGFNVMCYQLGLGTLTFVGASGVTLLQRANTFTTAGQYANASLVSVASNQLILSGDLN